MDSLSANQKYCDRIEAAGLVKDERGVEAMRAVDRAYFCPSQNEAYQDAPQRIGFNATISAPHMHATAVEFLKDQLVPGNKVLDVGSGSGYLTAILAFMVRGKENGGAPGRAVGIDHIPELSERSQKAAARIPFAQEMIQEGNLLFVAGDGLKGYAEQAPYQAIHVGASVSEIPKELLEQLAPGGRLVVPVGVTTDAQVLTIVDRDQDGNYLRENKMSVMFIPLQSKESQLGLLSKVLVSP